MSFDSSWDAGWERVRQWPLLLRWPLYIATFVLCVFGYPLAMYYIPDLTVDGINVAGRWLGLWDGIARATGTVPFSYGQVVAALLGGGAVYIIMKSR